MGLGKFSDPLRVRITTITGQQIPASIRKIINDVSFPSEVQFEGITRGTNGKGKQSFSF